jgi:hypothetical protein
MEEGFWFRTTRRSRGTAPFMPNKSSTDKTRQSVGTTSTNTCLFVEIRSAETPQVSCSIVSKIALRQSAKIFSLMCAEVVTLKRGQAGPRRALDRKAGVAQPF